ncbi:MAG: hypothetical protein DMD84_02385 [Candidatus Rokuibacteriota bacterium]|nr:MAG: hypothetical protein DMD84_02385 [Candidatus Rokubacteria bacterium]
MNHDSGSCAVLASCEAFTPKGPSLALPVLPVLPAPSKCGSTSATTTTSASTSSVGISVGSQSAIHEDSWRRLPNPRRASRQQMPRTDGLPAGGRHESHAHILGDCMLTFRSVLGSVILAVGLALAVATAGHAMAAEFVISDLGTLGGTFSIATGVNDLGQVVGYSATAANRRAVDGDERPGRSRTRVVEGLR